MPPTDRNPNHPDTERLADVQRAVAEARAAAAAEGGPPPVAPTPLLLTRPARSALDDLLRRGRTVGRTYERRAEGPSGLTG